MNEFQEYMRPIEAEIAGLASRLAAVESILTGSANGVIMQPDASKLPTVVFENTPPLIEAPANGND